MLKFSPRVLVFLRFILFHWIIFFLMRLAFFFLFSGAAGELELASILKAFYLGAKFDLRAVMWLLLPMLALSWLPLINLRKNRKFWTGFYAIASFFWFSLFFVDFGYFAYLNTRVNSSLITFLYNAKTSANMILENYPVGWGALATFVFVYIYANFLNRYVLRQNYFFVIKKSMPNVLGIIAFSVLFIGGLYGKFSYYPLRWSEAFFSPNNFTSNLALNPHLYLSKTLRHRNVTYDVERIKEDYEFLSEYFEVNNPDKDSLNFIRHIPAKEKSFEKMPNVVVIVMESFVAYKTGLWNNPIDAGPNVTALAKKGLYFSEYYVPVEGTARSMFALMTGVADLSKYKTASRNPMIVNQNVIMNYFDDYNKVYMLGGSANWGNIRGVFSNNVDGIDIVEEGDYSEDRVDVWGLSDYHLFKEAIRKLNSQPKDKSFFAVVQASSYHRPYTVPENIPGFQSVEKTEDELKYGGFISNQEYNSFRFSDYSLGEFMKWAKEQDWYENTLFVITGDHGVPDNGAPFRTKSRVEIETAPFHVPLIFYSEKLIPEAQEIKKVASEMDVMPSIASFVGIEYKNQAMGRDLFNPAYDSKRFALTYTYHRTGEYGLVGEGHYLKVKPNGRFLYQLDNEAGAVDLKDDKPELFQKMSKAADALLEFGKYMLYNNKPLVNKKAQLN